MKDYYGTFHSGYARIVGSQLQGVDAQGYVWPIPAEQPPIIIAGAKKTGDDAPESTSSVDAFAAPTTSGAPGEGIIIRPPRVNVLANILLQSVGTYTPGYGQPVSAVRQGRIVGTFQDTGPWGSGDAANLMQPQYKSPWGPNLDVRFYQVQYLSDAGVWTDFCPTEAGKPPNAAVFFNGYIDAAAKWYGSSQYIGVACADGTATKCMRWGYKPWRTLNPGTGPVALDQLWRSCYQAAMADYCKDGVTHTVPGTIIDVWDRYGFILPVPESQAFNSPWDAAGPSAFSAEASFNASGTCISRRSATRRCLPPAPTSASSTTAPRPAVATRCPAASGPRAVPRASPVRGTRSSAASSRSARARRRRRARPRSSTSPVGAPRAPTRPPAPALRSPRTATG